VEITREADYAVRAVLEMSLQPDRARIRSTEIARKYNIPAGVLTRLLARLSAEAIVDSQRGAGGGVRLRLPACDVTLLQVVEAIDGPITLNRCTLRPGECPNDGSCVVHPVWMMLRDALRALMAGVTFDKLARDARVRDSSAAFVPMGEVSTHVKGERR
jgi:Rrf2 family protein